MRFVPFSALCLIGLIAVASCDRSSPVDPTASFDITPATPVLLKGGSVSLAASSSTTGVAKWTSSNSTIATVDSTGLVTAIATGSAVIRLTSNEGFGETGVQVIDGGGTLRTSWQTTCGVATSGSLYCWGNNNRGQVGIGNRVTPQLAPMKVNGGLTFTSVTMGAENMCGMTTIGPYCWGYYTADQIGDGTPVADPNSPVKVIGGDAFSAIESGGAYLNDFGTDQTVSSTTCALTAAGALQCWGATWWYPTKFNTYSVQGAPAIKSVSQGTEHTCGISADKHAYCWGTNIYLGLGTTTPTGDYTAAQLIDGNRKFQAISAGRGYSCAIDVSGDAYCWGANGSGQLGAPSSETCRSRFVTTPCRSLPTKISGEYKFESISAGTAAAAFSDSIAQSHTCGVTTHQEIVCWGRNTSGELGNGSTQDSQTPVKVSSSLAFKSVTVGYSHTCGLTLDGVGYCWGGNTFGQLGTRSTTNTAVPVAVGGGLVFR